MKERINQVVKILHQELKQNKDRINFTNEDEIERQRNHFIYKFSKQNLQEMSSENALSSLMHLGNPDSMVYYLEFKNDDEFDNGYFGSISGGSAGKYTIFHSNKYKQWVKWESGKQVPISDANALQKADEIRKKLLVIHEVIDSNPHKTLKDVREMISKLEANDDIKDFYRYGWVHKYFHLHYPDKIACYHSGYVFKSFLVKTRHPFGNIITKKEERNAYILDLFYIDLANSLNVAQHNLSILVEKIKDVNKTVYFKVDIFTYNNEDLESMLNNDYFFAPFNLNKNLTEVTSLNEMKKYLKKMNYEEYSISKIYMATKTIASKDFIVLLENRKIKYLGVVQGEYEYINNERFQHRIPTNWYRVKKADEFKLSSNVSNFINKVNRASDQVNIEKAFEDAKQIEESNSKQVKRKIKPLIGIMKDINSLLNKKKQLILAGPPGTGKTYWAVNTVYELVARQMFKSSYNTLSQEDKELVKNSDFIKVLVMHSNYGYEEFVEGLRPLNTDEGNLVFDVSDGVFKSFADRANKDPDSDYYLILDEINRTDLTKVFGELIYLIENTKRGELIELSTSKNPFTVPQNLYILGTMNNADKSVAMIDLALRRRFGFIKLNPNYEIINTVIFDNVSAEELSQGTEELMQESSGVGYDSITELNISDWLRNVNEKLVKTLGSEGKDLQIGHSYFLSKEEVITEPGQFIDVLKYEIIPLLEEYTYGNTQQLKRILGEKLFDSSDNTKEELLQKANFSKLVQALEV